MTRTIIRRLTADDSAAYAATRLRALAEHPDAFSSSPSEDFACDLVALRERFETDWGGPHAGVQGAWREDLLLGLTGWFSENRNIKSAHRAWIWGVYVDPSARGQGLGRRLLDAALASVAAVPELEQIHLGVGVHNVSACRLYREAGFVAYGVDPAAVRVDGRDYDELLMWRPVRSG